jgi:hypothetical protein
VSILSVIHRLQVHADTSPIADNLSPMPRPPDWPHRLAEAIATARTTPFAWGRNDCPTFAFDTRHALTGEDTAALWRCRYSSYHGGLRLMRRLGWPSLAAMGDALLGAPLAAPLLAQRGDIVLSADGRGFGVCLGATAVGMAPEGLMTLPLTTCTRAWRI